MAEDAIVVRLINKKEPATSMVALRVTIDVAKLFTINYFKVLF